MHEIKDILNKYGLNERVCLETEREEDYNGH